MTYRSFILFFASVLFNVPVWAQLGIGEYSPVVGPGGQVAGYRDLHRPEKLTRGAVKNTYVITYSVGSNASDKLKFFVPPGTIVFSANFLTYLSSEEAKGVMRMNRPPVSDLGLVNEIVYPDSPDYKVLINYSAYSVVNSGSIYGGVPPSGMPDFGGAFDETILKNILNKKEVYFYGRGGAGLMPISYGGKEIPKPDVGGYVYGKFQYPGGRLLSMQWFLTVDKDCYDNWYKNAVWDSSGNPVEVVQHTCSGSTGILPDYWQYKPGDNQTPPSTNSKVPSKFALKTTSVDVSKAETHEIKFELDDKLGFERCFGNGVFDVVTARKGDKSYAVGLKFNPRFPLAGPTSVRVICEPSPSAEKSFADIQIMGVGGAAASPVRVDQTTLRELSDGDGNLVLQFGFVQNSETTPNSFDQNKVKSGRFYVEGMVPYADAFGGSYTMLYRLKGEAWGERLFTEADKDLVFRTGVDLTQSSLVEVRVGLKKKDLKCFNAKARLYFDVEGSLYDLGLIYDAEKDFLTWCQ